MKAPPLTLRRSALVAGTAYLVAIFMTPYMWIDPYITIGDAATTFSDISAREPLFRLGIASWLVVIMADALVAWALYHFFYGVSRSLSLLALCLRLMFVPVMAFAVFQWVEALLVVVGAKGLTGESFMAAQEQAMFYFVAYEYAANIAFMIFGLHVGLIGYLAFRSGYVPRILGIVLMFAGIGYQVDTFASILSGRYAAEPAWFVATVAVPAFLSEFMLTLWLLIKGVRLPRSVGPELRGGAAS